MNDQQNKPASCVRGTFSRLGGLSPCLSQRVVFPVVLVCLWVVFVEHRKAKHQKARIFRTIS